ncbi:hypothetical protein PG990_002461 [Apiospora arundinis]
MSPVFPTSPLLASLVNRDPVSSLTTSITALATNSTLPDPSLPPWQVICAWPVSGQYGPGSRILYYALVAACILARKTEWLRNACLAAGLLFPAIAAFHGIVLAAMHIDGAVDMDVYGAFQLCSIGILAAPVTVRWSKTYFYDPARNLIFLWTGLILAGLLSLTVEFYRLGPIACGQDEEGNVISPALSLGFPYETDICNITCSEKKGPWSPLRQGSTSEIFIIPAPQKLTFGAATLVAAACCIPAILSMVSMWNKILEINWKRRWGNNYVAPRLDEEIEGTNGATVGKMMNVNDIIRSFLSVVQIPVFVGAVLAIMVIGEMNFWSESVNYQTEPVSSIGQWAPIVGTVLAALGSLYVLGMNPRINTPADPSSSNASVHYPNSSQHGLNHHPSTPRHDVAHVVHVPPRDSGDLGDPRNIIHESPVQHTADSPEMVSIRRLTSPSPASPDLHRNMSNGSEDVRPDAGGRRKMARMIGGLGRYMGTPAPDLFDDSEFKHGKALDFPEIPGEAERNADLVQVRLQYNPPRDSEDESPPLRRTRSRAESFTSIAAGYDAMGISISRSASPSRVPSARSNTLPVGRTPQDDAAPHITTADSNDARPRRRETLEVPSPARYHGSSWNSPQTTNENVVTSTEESTQDSSPPTIVISAEPEASSSRAPATSIPDPTPESSIPGRPPLD